MPREQINYEKVKTLVDEGVISDLPPTGDQVRVGTPTLHVSWLRDGFVQVAIEGDVSYFRFAANTPDGVTSDRSTVYTEPLDRDEINKMIRTLRRARDQVFGRDE